jgi:hypothetical protein
MFTWAERPTTTDFAEDVFNLRDLVSESVCSYITHKSYYSLLNPLSVWTHGDDKWLLILGRVVFCMEKIKLGSCESRGHSHVAVIWNILFRMFKNQPQRLLREWSKITVM